MRKLNPEIEKFWTDAGYSIIDCRPSAILNNSMWCLLWGGNKNSNAGSSITIAVSETIGYKGSSEESVKLKYCLNHELYSEEEMLRIIKLKTFI